MTGVGNACDSRYLARAAWTIFRVRDNVSLDFAPFRLLINNLPLKKKNPGPINDVAYPHFVRIFSSWAVTISIQTGSFYTIRNRPFKFFLFLKIDFIKEGKIFYASSLAVTPFVARISRVDPPLFLLNFYF